MYRFMLGLSRVMTGLGGVMLCLLVLMTCASIAGRLLNGALHNMVKSDIAPDFANWALAIGIGPITGDFELVEAGMAFAVFAFIPLCQITAGHASVDIFANFLPRGLDRLLRAVTEVIFAAVLVVIAVQLLRGMTDKIGNGETSFLLAYPVWWAYALSLFGATAAAVVGIYMGAVRVYEFLTRRIVVQDGSGA